MAFKILKFTTDCERMEEMIKVNAITKKVDDYTLRLAYNRTCKGYAQPENGFYIKHEEFVDYLRPTNEKNVYERLKNNERYKVLDIKKNLYGEENIFILETPSNEIEIYHKQWDGSLTLLQKEEKTWIEKLFN